MGKYVSRCILMCCSTIFFKCCQIVDSYRPINNLATLEKIVEQHIKMHLETYLCTNNIILNCHHGSRKFHGTNTAITHITNEINTDYENNLITATVVEFS